MSCIEFLVNGEKCSVDGRVPRDTSLNAFLRYHLALPGTKSMCHQGGCGACVVSVRAYNHTTDSVVTFSVNSCLVLVFTCHGWDITTIEGLGNKKDGYHTIQSRVAQFNATQCGYCTSGWVMQLYSLLDKNLTMAELEDSFGSNTCRCTGYRPILDTVKSFAIDASADLCNKVRDIEDLPICKKTQQTCERKCSTRSNDSDWSIINELTISPQDGDVIQLNFGGHEYFKVYTEAQIFQTFIQYGTDSYMLLDGNTARGVLDIYEHPTHIIDIRDVKCLKQYGFDQNMVLGANMSIQDCITLFKDVAKSRTEFAYLKEFVKHLQLVAHIPVRNIGSLAGNMMIKHKKPDFQSDIFVLFATVGATMTISDIFGNRKELSMLEFLEYDMRGVLIMTFKLPPFGPSHVFRSYKILSRSQNALALVNAGFLLEINSSNIINYSSVVYGNISPSFIHARRTEAYLVGKNVFSNEVLQGAIQLLGAELKPAVDPAKPSPECRRKMAIGLFYKFILNISPNGLVSPCLRSGAFLLERPVSSGRQEFQTDPSLYPITQPVQKYEGLIQSSGEAHYANDIPPMKREVFGAFVQSTIHNGELDFIDATEVLKLNGVLALYTAKDFPGVNSFVIPGMQCQNEEEEILASTKILFYGQPVAIIVAESQALAAKVATEVKVTYKNVSSKPPVLTIDEAKKDSKRIITSDYKIEPKGRGTNTTKVIRGVYETGAQYHYYLEPLSCVVFPVDGKLDVYDASQWMDLPQNVIARCLNMKASDIFVKVRRIGGGFGGKISRNTQVTTSCALVAKKLNRPCRFVLPMATNLTIAGRRLPSQCEYEVGVDDNGKIQYLDASIVEDVGCSNNENFILSLTVGSFPNCYNKDYFRLKIASALTDLPSNTFARAPGTAEGISSIEHIMEHIAAVVKKDPTDVRLVNMRTEDNDLPELIETLKKRSEYDRRYNEIQLFNKSNRWVKKAIRISVMLYPVLIIGNFSAMVSIYKDGSVTVTTGGIEMGQGVNTKVRQVVAYELDISIEQVTVLPHFCFVAANNSISGASIVSEAISYAAIKACGILKSRLKPVSDSLTNPTWLAIIQKANELRVDLTANYMMTDTDPELVDYSAFAVAILDGQLDVLTGEYILNRLDILEDVGRSINPAVDVGQVEGAYIQGLSYLTTEEFKYDKRTGKLLSNDALSYDVYLAKDIPVDMRVLLRFNSKNPKGVLGSKAVGEMGISTAPGANHVLRQCIMESLKDSGCDPHEWINIGIPYTKESILKALNVKPSEFILT